MQLTLALPGLLAQPPEALAAVGMLSRLAAVATPQAEIDVDSALLRALGVDAATGPLAALGAGLDVNKRWIMRADPVVMSAGHDDVRLDARIDDLRDDEAAALCSVLSQHFADDGLVFEAPRADTVFVASTKPYALDTTPVEAAIGRSLRTRLPTGPDAALWRRWFTEAQMLLHAHPLAERSPHPVNALWFSGGGELSAAARVRALRVFVNGRHACDVARGLAIAADTGPQALETLRALVTDASHAEHIVAVSSGLDPIGALESLRTELDHVWHALERGAIKTLVLIASGGGNAASWRARRPTWFQRMRRSHERFTLPEPTDPA